MSYRLTTIISATGIFLLPAGCFTTCFIAGTRIHTPSGPKPIEALTVGEAVWAWCNETQQPVVRPIVRLFRGESRETFRIQAGEFVVEGVTGEHPFWNPETNDWVKAKHLAVGDAVLGWPGQDSAKTLHIHHIETQRTSELRPVYTLGVEGDEQNYFAENILVHNKTILSPGEPLDDPFSSCVSVENGIKIVDFDEVSVGTTHTQDVRLIPNPECLGRLDGDELTAEVDDPDDAFSIENGLGIPFEQFMQGDGHLLQMAFEPQNEGEFEAQIRLGFPSTFDEEIQQDLILQLFGAGVEVDESSE